MVVHRVVDWTETTLLMHQMVVVWSGVLLLARHITLSLSAHPAPCLCDYLVHHSHSICPIFFVFILRSSDTRAFFIYIYWLLFICANTRSQNISILASKLFGQLLFSLEGLSTPILPETVSLSSADFFCVVADGLADIFLCHCRIWHFVIDNRLRLFCYFIPYLQMQQRRTMKLFLRWKRQCMLAVEPQDPIFTGFKKKFIF